MKYLFFTIFLFINSIINAQSVLHAGEPDWCTDLNTTQNQKNQLEIATAGCGTPFLSTGYPVFTNFWAGWMINIINTNVCPIVINNFEARFQGTSGYRIYTKTGTFIGFETTGGAWTLVGTLASLTGTSTVAPTAVPIVVNVVIPAGGSQAFYLTRSDNVIANRHLYVTGAGIAGITIYAANADLSITEGSYINPFFAALQVGSRRPSFDVCYTVNCTLPIELLSFTGTSSISKNQLNWECASETNNDYFLLERSTDGIEFKNIAIIDAAGNSSSNTKYSFIDLEFEKTVNYYKLSQVDFNGMSETFNLIAIDNTSDSKITLVKRLTVLGTDLPEDYEGVYIEVYSNGTYFKKCCNPK